METTQIYSLVNSVYGQMVGVTPLTATNTDGLIAMGNSILSSDRNTEAFVNTLVQRIGKTIVSYRKYTNQLKGLMLDDFEWGAIVQKLKVEMPDAVEDETYNLTDGESVDMYIVKKPVVKQKLFVTRTPYSFFVTTNTSMLKEAFLSETAMGAFISAIYGEVQNKLELVMEDLGRVCIANFMANLGNSQVINLVTNYNEAINPTTPITADTALFEPQFLRYAIGQIKSYAKRLVTMSKLYNKENEARHTPIELQRYCSVLDFQNAMETVVQYEAFHEQYVSKVPTIEVPYWQSADKPMSINITTGGKSVKIDNIVGFIHDRDALGMYKKTEDVLTTPINARGRYMNTFYHEQQLWFNDMSENGIMFTLN